MRASMWHRPFLAFGSKGSAMSSASSTVKEREQHEAVPFLVRWETWESAPVDSKKIGADDTKTWIKYTEDRDT